MFHNNKLISFFFLLFIIFLEKNVIEVTTKQEFDALFTKEKGNRVVAGFYDQLYFDKSFSNSFFSGIMIGELQRILLRSFP